VSVKNTMSITRLVSIYCLFVHLVHWLKYSTIHWNNCKSEKLKTKLAMLKYSTIHWNNCKSEKLKTKLANEQNRHNLVNCTFWSDNNWLEITVEGKPTEKLECNIRLNYGKRGLFFFGNSQTRWKRTGETCNCHRVG
jgi:hypothetical protein